MSTSPLPLEPHPPSTARWLPVAWTAVAGYVMGFAALQVILDHRFVGDTPPWRVFLVALAPASLSAAVAFGASSARHWAAAGFASLSGALLSSLACPPLSFGLLRLAGGEPRGEASAILVITLFGPFIAGPLGFSFGLIYAAVLAPMAAMRTRAAAASTDAVVVLAGLGWMAVGPGCAFAARALQPAGAAPAQAWALGWGLCLVGAATAAAGVVRWERRWRFVQHVRAGREPEWSVAASDRIPQAHHLPRLFPIGRADRVLMRRRRTAAGPHRTAETSEPVLRV